MRVLMSCSLKGLDNVLMPILILAKSCGVIVAVMGASCGVSITVY